MTFTREDTKMVKGAAIALMLYHHLFAYSDRITGGNYYIPLLTFTSTDSAQLMGLFGKLCVALFLFLGGYGTYLSWASRAKKLGDGAGQGEAMSQFVLAKLKALYTPFLKVFCVVVPVAVLLGDSRVQASVAALVWNATGLNITYNGEWWFFTDYVILLVAFPLMWRFVSRRRATLPLDVLCVFAWVAATTWVIPSLMELECMQPLAQTLLWSKLYETSIWSPYFLMGCICARWDVLSRAKSALAGRGLWCVAALLSLPVMVAVRFKLGVDYRYDFLLAPILAIALAVLATTRPGAVVGRGLQFVGKHGTGVWLTHSFFCYHWCQAFVFAPHYSILVFLLLLAMSLATTMLIDLLWKGIGKGVHALDAKTCYEVR